jgi:protein-tyrosine-phosphatase
MAAAWFKHLCDEEGIDYIDVDSAGLATRPRDAVSSKARAVLAEHDLLPLRLGSQLLTPKQLFRADLIMTMTVAHQEALVSRHPSVANKCRPLVAELPRLSGHDEAGARGAA